MKIVCDNCSAKYSIADEKVAGKVFKIRCKKCTNVIVVRGDQLDAAEQESATQVYDYGGEAVWHVVIDGDQQGPYAPAQIGGLLTDGTIDWEAYVWKEGFDGWKPARDVPELVAAVTGDPSHAEQEAAPAAAAAVDPMAATAAAADPMGADPFASAGDAFGGEPFGGAPTEAARAASGGDAGADLFAQADASASPFGGGGVDDDVVASAASPRVSTEESMTGQRNENSVLFSLSNLQALATGGGGGAPAAGPAPSAGPAPGHASGEGSGLIDIRALASATASTGGPSPAVGDSGGASDLLSIGGGGGLGSSLGAPMLAPAAAEPEKRSKGFMIGMAAAAVMVVGLLVALVVVATQKPEPVVMAATPTAADPTTPVAAAVDPSATMDMPAAGTPVTSMTEEAETETETVTDEPSGNNSSRMRRRTSTNSQMMSTAAAPMDSAPAMTSRMASGSIDDLLNQALSGMMSAMSAPAMMAASNLPPQPGRDDVGRALRGVSSRVGSCGNGTSGVANAAITFASSGRVRSVRVTGVPPAVQSCVARTVRSARVSPFSRPTFNVNFPFRVR